ncbi:unnamed protein product, partial [Musa textilis]
MNCSGLPLGFSKPPTTSSTCTTLLKTLPSMAEPGGLLLNSHGTTSLQACSSSSQKYAAHQNTHFDTRRLSSIITRLHLHLVFVRDGGETHDATLDQFKAKVDGWRWYMPYHFLCTCLQKNNGNTVDMTPGCDLLGPDMLLKFAQSQADYILGRNPKSMSYLVGYGWNHPSRVRHRGASIPSVFVLPSAVGCIEGFDEWYVSKNGNPNVIEGALV